MPVIINGSTGISGNDGTAATPTIQGTDTNTGIYFPGADRIGFAEGGVQVGEFDASGNFLFNSGYGSVARAFGCRAWVNFNGTGTVAIRASGNVSSITDNDVGDYTVNFTTAMPDVNYCTNATGTRQTSVVYDYDFRATLGGTNFILTGSVRVFFGNTTGTGSLADATAMCVSIFR